MAGKQMMVRIRIIFRNIPASVDPDWRSDNCPTHDLRLDQTAQIPFSINGILMKWCGSYRSPAYQAKAATAYNRSTIIIFI